MRRLGGTLAFVVIALLGFGVSLVLAGLKQGTPGSGQITICHSGNGTSFTEITLDPSGVLSGHHGHAEDIIPPFTVVEQDGTTTHYPGKNMDRIYGEGYTGGEVLANHCVIPDHGFTETVETIPTGPIETIPTTVTDPGTTVTLPGTTGSTVVETTVTVPGETVTLPGDSTTATIPGGTTTVTTPGETVTLPGTTVTHPGETIQEPAQTVTVPGSTQTVTAVSTTTVTITTPVIRYIRGGVLAARIRLAIRHHLRLVRLPAHVHRLVLHVHERATVIVIVVSPKGCPAGSRIFNGRCAAIVHGRG
jgi:hypothetical protein